MSAATPKTVPVRIFIVDDEPIVRESLGAWFRAEGYAVELASSAKQALERLATSDPDIFLLDIKMPGMDGIELQKKIHEAKPEATIIIMTAYASVDTALAAMKQGAYDYIIKPFDPNDLEHLVRNAIERRHLVTENRELKARLDEMSPFSEIIGESPAMRRVLEQVSIVARSDTNVLTRGESGTGKELIARALHAASERRFLPIVVVNCGALSEGVIESELFGHEKGSFTGRSIAGRGSSRWPTAALSSSMRSATSASKRRWTCSAFWRKRRSSGWAATSRSPWTSVWWLRQIAPWKPWWPRESSARTSTTA